MQTQRFKVNSLTYHLLPVCLMLAICFLLFFRGIGETEFYDHDKEAHEVLVIWEIHNSGNWIVSRFCSEHGGTDSRANQLMLTFSRGWLATSMPDRLSSCQRC